MKKKKKLDIHLLKMRHERKIRKLEKAIRQLKKTPRQLKPIEEYKLPPAIAKEIPIRTRPLSEEDKQVLESIEKMKRVWLAYKSEERLTEMRCIRRMVQSQDRVLEILRSESDRLYEAAVALDSNFLPFEDNHIVTESAPNPEYVPPDGVKVDISKVWFM